MSWPPWQSYCWKLPCFQHNVLFRNIEVESSANMIWYYSPSKLHNCSFYPCMNIVKLCFFAFYFNSFLLKQPYWNNVYFNNFLLKRIKIKLYEIIETILKFLKWSDLIETVDTYWIFSITRSLGRDWAEAGSEETRPGRRRKEPSRDSRPESVHSFRGSPRSRMTQIGSEIYRM